MEISLYIKSNINLPNAFFAQVSENRDSSPAFTNAKAGRSFVKSQSRGFSQPEKGTGLGVFPARRTGFGTSDALCKLKLPGDRITRKRLKWGSNGNSATAERHLYTLPKRPSLSWISFGLQAHHCRRRLYLCLTKEKPRTRRLPNHANGR